MQNLKKLGRAIPFSIALIIVTLSLSDSPILANAAPIPPTMNVVPAVESVAVGGGTTFTVYVQVPNNQPETGTLYNLHPAFVVQSISQGYTAPDGTVTLPSTIVTCTTAGNKEYPQGYPSRNAQTTCSGLYPQRVDTRAYWGSNTAIYFLGLAGFSPAGTWTVTFVVTGLYYGSTISLTASAPLEVGRSTTTISKQGSLPIMSVVPAASTTSNDEDDFTVYVQVPDNKPVSGTFYDLQPAFIVQTISVGFTDPTGFVTPPSLDETCATKQGHGYPGYPSSAAQTVCSGIYQQRILRAYWNTNTAIYFEGFVGFSPTGTWTITYVVTGLYYGNTITLTASASFNVV